MNLKCPLCHGSRANLFYSQQKVNWDLYAEEKTQLDFFKCETCDLIFKDRSVILPLEKQRPRYLEHENLPSPEYEKFLMKLWLPLSNELVPGQGGLDFGCGPTKMLSSAAGKKGVTCEYYDPLFWPDKNLLQKTYDFIFCSEVVEHLVDVQMDWQNIKKLLKSGSILGVMTSFYPLEFSSWHYHRDPTHISFYSPKTFEWIAKNFGFKILRCYENIVVMKVS